MSDEKPKKLSLTDFPKYMLEGLLKTFVDFIEEHQMATASIVAGTGALICWRVHQTGNKTVEKLKREGDKLEDLFTKHEIMVRQKESEMKDYITKHENKLESLESKTQHLLQKQESQIKQLELEVKNAKQGVDLDLKSIQMEQQHVKLELRDVWEQVLKIRGCSPADIRQIDIEGNSSAFLQTLKQGLEASGKLQVEEWTSPDPLIDAKNDKTGTKEVAANLRGGADGLVTVKKGTGSNKTTANKPRVPAFKQSSVSGPAVAFYRILAKVIGKIPK